MRAGELRVEAHIESPVEIWAADQQPVQLGAARGEADRCWLELSVREFERLKCLVRARWDGRGGMLGEVESLECEHLNAVVVGCSAATGRGRVSEGHATTGRKVCAGRSLTQTGGGVGMKERGDRRRRRRWVAQVRVAAQARGGGTRRVLTPNQMEGGSHSGSWFCDQRVPWIEFFHCCTGQLTFQRCCRQFPLAILALIHSEGVTRLQPVFLRIISFLTARRFAGQP